MNEIQFKSLMQLNNPLIINAIINSHNVNAQTAIEMFYNSSLFEKYIDETTKIWHYSPVLIADLLKQEIETGEVEYPS